MTGKIDYTKLSIRGLKDLINQNDIQAEEEYTRRVTSGEIKLKSYTVEELAEKFKQAGYLG